MAKEKKEPKKEIRSENIKKVLTKRPKITRSLLALKKIEKKKKD